MKISEKYKVKETTSLFVSTRDEDKGNSDSFKDMENKVEKPLCEGCGYMDCICVLDKPLELSQGKA